ncbi:hypothetical protein A4A58_15140 [Tardiphaga robiniae]|uniref:Uncharacterized protein n=1 Tax=Tardiphaga robiniae TaxID=943830 RepID=A0A163XMN8_9BRAD|nr:hypothetical protein A4A58_15140 [Tardiphaga robiniae]
MLRAASFVTTAPVRLRSAYDVLQAETPTHAVLDFALGGGSVAYGKLGRLVLGTIGVISLGVIPIIECLHGRFPLVRMEVLHLINADQSKHSLPVAYWPGLTPSLVQT